MAALIARALCLPMEALSAMCDACSRVRCPRCPDCPPCARRLCERCEQCACCEFPCVARFLESRGSLCLAFSLAFSLAPGLAALGYCVGFGGPRGAGDACAASDGGAVQSMSLQGWLLGQFVLAAAGTAAAGYVWLKFQRPFNARDPRDRDWVARATWMACYDPGVAAAMVAELVEVAWLFIGARLGPNVALAGPGARAGAAPCDATLQAGFAAILTIAWVFLCLGGAGLFFAYLWACTCGRAAEAFDAEVAAAAAGGHNHHQPPPPPQALPQPLPQAPHAILVAAPQAHAPAGYYGAPQQAPPQQYGAYQHAAQAAEGLPYAAPVAAAHYGGGGGGIPVAVVHGGPLEFGGGGAPVAVAVQAAPYPHQEPPHHVQTGQEAAVNLARAGLGLLGSAAMVGARVAGQAVVGAAEIARQVAADHAATQQRLAQQHQQAQMRRY